MSRETKCLLFIDDDADCSMISVFLSDLSDELVFLVNIHVKKMINKKKNPHRQMIRKRDRNKINLPR